MRRLQDWLCRNWPLLLLLAGFVALVWPDHLGKSLYSANELPRDLGILRDMSHGRIILVGPDSCLGNFHFGPVYYYLAFPIAWLLNFSPYSLAAASIFYFILTISASFFAVMRWWGSRRLAYAAAALMATSIFTFQFAQYGSNPNFLPLFSLVFFYALERLLAGSRRLGPALALGLAFGFAAQLHAVPLLCLPLILLYALLRRQIRPSWRQAAVFLLVVVLVFAPYLAYEFSHNFANFRGLLAIAGGGQFHTPLAERLVEYLGFWLVPVLSVHNFFDAVAFGGAPLLAVLAMGLAGFWLVFKFAPQKPEWADGFDLSTPPRLKILLEYWLIIPSLVIVLASGTANGLRIYYFLMLYPAIFFLLALGLFKMAVRGYAICALYLCGLYLILQGLQIGLYRWQVAHLITWVIK